MTEPEIRERFFETLDAAEALASRTAEVDRLVREGWAAMPAEATAMAALAAVGGYGRRELFPYSDIDLLILTPDEKGAAAIGEPLSFFIRDLWDRKLRISQSVHDPRDCNQIDAANAELAVSLLDRRLLAGNESLFGQIHDPGPDLGRNIVELTRARHAQFQHTIYQLEPDVKEAPGGLRDLQVARWLAKLGAEDGNAAGLVAGVPLLFTIRCFLHYLNGRDDNRFTFERQDEIAGWMRAVSPEALMRRYYRAARGISRLAERRLERFEARGSSFFAQYRDRTRRLSNAQFGVSNGIVRVGPGAGPEDDPAFIFRLFEFVGRHGLALSSELRERVERSAGIFAEWVCGHQPVWPAFRTILQQPHAAKAVRAMHETHVLEAMFPELLEIDALVIRDFYHRYTVDEHTLVAIETATGLRENPGDGFGELAAETEDTDLLIAAFLFHDVGKAHSGESHVISSQRIAEKALRRAGIGERALGVVSFLILSHLELSAAMNGRDLSDPVSIRAVAEKMATVERLKLLTLFTYGDISAVNPSAMTAWRRQLLWNLYTATYSELTRELTARTGLPDAGGSAELRHFLTGLPPRYLRTHSAEEIEAHLRLDRSRGAHAVGVALERSTAWVLTVVGEDRPFLFASIAGTLSSFGFNILKAEAFSNAHGTVIDTFTFEDPARNLELNPGEGSAVTRTVVKVLDGDLAVGTLMTRRPRVKPDERALAAGNASFDNEASAWATLVQLTSQDRPGLLYDVASLISVRGGNIEIVLVDTEARKAIDVFYVTKGGTKLSDAEATGLVEALSLVARGRRE